MINKNNSNCYGGEANSANSSPCPQASKWILTRAQSSLMSTQRFKRRQEGKQID